MPTIGLLLDFRDDQCIGYSLRYPVGQTLCPNVVVAQSCHPTVMSLLIII